MGEDAKPEDVLKVMEAVCGLALKMRRENDKGEVGPLDLIKTLRNLTRKIDIQHLIIYTIHT